MNNFLNIVINLMIGLTVISCSNKKSEFKELEIEAEKTSKYMQVAPAGGIDIEKYTFPAEVVRYVNDTLFVKIKRQDGSVDLIKVPNQDKKRRATGTTVDIVASLKKLGVPNLGWKYNVKYRQQEEYISTKPKQDFKIPIKKEDFKKLASYIQINGFTVTQQGVPCDKQLTFFDKNKNRHALIAIKRDQKGQPSMKGTVDQISVWAYKNGIKNSENFFGYGIHENSINPFNYPQEGEKWEERDVVKKAFMELLKKAK